MWQFKTLARTCLSCALILILSVQAGFLYAAPEGESFSSETVFRLRQQYADPFLAGFLSGMYWGLGHFYAKDYSRGSLFMFGDLVYKGLALGLAVKLKNKYAGQQDNGVRWGELSGTDKGLVIGTAVVWLGITALSAYDAGETAKKFNGRINQLLRVDVRMREVEGSAVSCLGWNTQF
jgi:hypothetical protein